MVKKQKNALKTLQQDNLILLQCCCSIFLLQKLNLLRFLIGEPHVASYIHAQCSTFLLRLDEKCCSWPLSLTLTSSNSKGPCAFALKFSAKQINLIRKKRVSAICKMININEDFRIFMNASHIVFLNTKTQKKLKRFFFFLKIGDTLLLTML